MSRSVYEYDVDVQTSNPNTLEVKRFTRRELAYSVVDAWQQALIAVGADAGSAEVKITAIRPTPEAIQQAALTLADAVQTALSPLLSGAKPPKPEPPKLRTWDEKSPPKEDT